ncbi:TraG-like protein, N-terminal region [Escherichia coli]|uniref:TraG-like protein, N-terminal region n=1 Tax=Escherichia coli TaxID=562 RepID=A0A376KHR4_ECOLX|nr:TraG-like protein, N-terminal region [Escherichia coli]
MRIRDFFRRGGLSSDDNNYLEYFLTLLGWLVNNGLWDLLIGTGLFALPLAFKVIGIWLKVREEGADEGNKGMLLVTPHRECIVWCVFCDGGFLCTAGSGDAGYPEV